MRRVKRASERLSAKSDIYQQCPPFTSIAHTVTVKEGRSTARKEGGRCFSSSHVCVQIAAVNTEI